MPPRSNAVEAFPDSVRLPRVPELDGLRALLAWWVVVYHARGPMFSSIEQIHFGPLGILDRGGLAVDVFMILSGFVIAFLMDRSHERAAPFLLRRFLRLFPAYVACLVPMLFLQGVLESNIRANQGLLEPAVFATLIRGIAEPMQNLAAQIGAHLLMLHGAIPETWLYNSAGAFLQPAWSISLEWQFYLAAPLAFWLLRRGRPGIAIALLVTAVAFATRNIWPRGLFGVYGAFLPLNLHWFAVGIGSFHVFRRVAHTRPAPALLARAPGAVGIALLGLVAIQTARLGVARATTPALWFPMALWCLVFAVLLAGLGGGAGPIASAVARALRWRPLHFLGGISYSTYLVHWPVLTLCQAAFRNLTDASPVQTLALHVMVSFPLIAAASWLLYRWVEAPAIELGRRLARRV
jgi:peptidoglycan/LPS O-acetylase OafA/YrhL